MKQMNQQDSDFIIRISNIFQGLVAIGVILLALAEKPIWMVLLSLIIIFATGITIISLRMETPKGRKREAIEMLFIVFSIAAVVFTKKAPFPDPASKWMIIFGVPSLLMNLGGITAWIFQGFVYFLEWTSGEPVSIRSHQAKNANRTVA